ncbi:InlB B-repeat-containing protein [Flammeovirga aprica]|uniref:T9SS type A sorting domain-containing protein n=1 Tax=Flammeovirga aprica JL-4 TaxID=694437 RepID=A0A7X9RYH8_9BACT|nr:T9SS type A sorting domain-containing protein [Flammeovirga aprica]NME71014.1 T9SS type A sorting domain-containing protein [Flammeovirga aprica JL-4]
MKKFLLFNLIILFNTFLSWSQIKPDQGDGSLESPFIVSTLEHLKWISEGDGGEGDGTRWKYNFKQVNDIDANATSTWNSGEGFRPIGWFKSSSDKKTFKGVYDGNGFAIHHLVINRPNANYIGLFGYTESGTIKNLTLTNVSITGSQYTGALGGKIDLEGIVENVKVSGTVTAYRHSGGVFGDINNSSSLNYVFSSVNVMKGDYTDDKNFGGIAGRVYNKSIIQNTISIGKVVGIENIGGVIGVGHTDPSSNKVITITNVYWDKETSNVTTDGYSAETVGLNTADFSDNNNFTGFDFEGTWGIGKLTVIDNNLRPYLQTDIASNLSVVTNSSDFGSVTTEGDLYIGQTITLTAVSKEGYVFDKWLEDDIEKGTSTTLSFELGASHTIEAIFKAIPTYTITVLAVENGVINPGTVTLEEGSDQTFTIEANAGYEISDVTVDGVSQGVIKSYSFENLSSNHTIGATFSLIPPTTYTITVSDVENGSINPGTVILEEGSDQTFTIEANTGYEISDVTVDGVSQGVIESYSFENLSSDHTIGATFTLIPPTTYTITVLDVENGVINPGTVTLEEGSDQTFTIEANAGYEISDITVDGVSQGVIESYSFENLSSDHTIGATFSLIPPTTYTITVLEVENGSITPGTVTLEEGSDQTFTIEAEAGYEISDVTVDGVSQGVIESYSFENLSSDHTIGATFSLIPPTTYTITVLEVENGAINPGTITLEEGSAQTFTIEANAGYEISDVTVDGVSQDVIESYSFENLSADHTIGATFSLIPATTYTITVLDVENGTVNPGTVTLEEGSAQTFTIEANAGYEISDVTVDGVSQGVIESYSFENLSSDHTIGATFSLIPPTTYTITVSNVENGTINPGTVTLEEGSDQTFTITADENYMLSDVLIDGVSVGPLSSYTFTDLKANHTIEAEFNRVYWINVTETTDGSVSPSSMQVVAGQNQTFIFTPDEGYSIGEVLINGESVGSVESYTFKEVEADMTLEVLFELDELPTSVGGLDQVKIQLAPNPVENQLQVKGIPANTAIAVYDVIGNLVYKSTTTSKVLEINFSLLKSGLYILQVEKIGNFKVVKQ